MPVITRGVRYAKDLLRTIRARPPVPVEKLARKYAQIVRESLPSDISGMLVPLASTDEKSRWAIVVNANDAPVRQRFTIAHELGHLLIHRYLTPHADGRYQVRFRNEKSASGSVREEIEANQFAAELLMPERDVRHLAIRLRLDVLDSDADKEAVRKLMSAARRFQVSVQAPTGAAGLRYTSGREQRLTHPDRSRSNPLRQQCRNSAPLCRKNALTGLPLQLDFGSDASWKGHGLERRVGR